MTEEEKLLAELEKLVFEEYTERGLTYDDGRRNGILNAISIVKSHLKGKVIVDVKDLLTRTQLANAEDALELEIRRLEPIAVASEPEDIDEIRVKLKKLTRKKRV